MHYNKYNNNYALCHRKDHMTVSLSSIINCWNPCFSQRTVILKTWKNDAQGASQNVLDLIRQVTGETTVK